MERWRWRRRRRSITSWGVALHLTPRGLITPLLPYDQRSFTMEFDFVDHQLITRTTDGQVRAIALRPQPVAGFYGEVMALLTEMSLPVRIWPVSVEMPTAVRLDQDVDHDAYDAEAVGRFWRALRSIARVLADTRCSFVGKGQPRSLLLGRLRPCRDAVFGATGAAARRPRLHARSVLKGSHQPRLLAGRRTDRRGRVLRVRGSRARGPQGRAPRPEASYYHSGLGEFILPVRGRAHRGIAGASHPAILSTAPTTPRRHLPSGIARRSNARSY